MKREKGFVLITVMIVVFVLSTLGIMRLMLSATRTADIAYYVTDLQLLYLAETGINRAQAQANGDSFLVLNGQEYSLGNGSYEIAGSSSGMLRSVTVNSYIPNKTNKKYDKTIAISGSSITDNYSWREY